MRAIIAGVLISAAVVGAVEVLFRKAGGLPSVAAGLTRVEFQWKVKRARDRDGVVLYVVGDSRVGWGFAERIFNREYASLAGSDRFVAVNVGLAAANVPDNLEYILRLNAGRPPQAIVLNYSPAAFYLFLNDPGPPIPGLKIQDVLDDRLDSHLAEWLWTRGRWHDTTAQIWGYLQTRRVAGSVNFVHRTAFDDGFVNATLATNIGTPVDNAAFQLAFYRRMIAGLSADAANARKRRARVSEIVRSGRALGWRVVLVRLPLGAAVREVEAGLPQDLQADALAKALDVPFVDYATDPRTAAFDTLDGSHLTPEAARAFAPIMAGDLYRMMNDEFDALDRPQS